MEKTDCNLQDVMVRLGKGEEIMKQNRLLSCAVLSILGLLFAFMWDTSAKASANQAEISALVVTIKAVIADIERLGEKAKEHTEELKELERDFKAQIESLSDRFLNFYNRVDEVNNNSRDRDETLELHIGEGIGKHEARFDHQRNMPARQ